ncbi:MAG TPA: HlyD family efflux transporter periplasmic adaptor subunit [Polyangiaceae bacterium]|nr:HlyD family efflux transporter periplasmic adaptor subunit [Polyangiaceae bacterium]
MPTADAKLVGRDAALLAAALRHLALQRSLPDMARVMGSHLAVLLSGSADCVFHDPEGSCLWREGHTMGDLPSSSGLIGALLWNPQQLVVPRADADPRYRKAVDLPDGKGDEAIALQPVLGANAIVHAVLVVAREPGEQFSARDRAILAGFAARVAPIFESLHLELLAAEQPEHTVTAGDHLFDPAVLAAHRAGKLQGELVDLPGLMPAAAYPLALVTVIILLLLGSAYHVDRYAHGPGVLLARDGALVTAPIAGVFDHYVVQNGEPVRAGQPVAYLKADLQRNDLKRATRELEHALAARLAAPSDTTIEASAAAAAIAHARARERLAELTLTAPRDGIVTDARLSGGQAVSAGQTVTSVLPRSARFVLVAALPPHHRPALRREQRLLLELKGYPHTQQDLAVAAVGDRVLTSAEIEALFGRDLGDAINADRGAVIVEAPFERTHFSFEGASYALHAGMVGTADVVIGSEPALFMLAPFLKDWVSL